VHPPVPQIGTEKSLHEPLQANKKYMFRREYQ